MKMTMENKKLVVNEIIEIPNEEINFQWARSSGPGGQNVNKVNSKAILIWNIVGSQSLPTQVFNRFESKFKNRISIKGDLIIASDSSRDRLTNMRICLNKLKDMINEVSYPPKARKSTKPKRSAVEKRLTQKKQKSDKKKNRGKVQW